MRPRRVMPAADGAAGTGDAPQGGAAHRERRRANMKEKMAAVLLPRGRKQEENFVIVSVNGRSWKIMRGVEVRVPVCVAEVLENARMMAEEARRYVDQRAS